MDMIIWLGVFAALVAAVWMAAPYHNRIIENREINIDKPWD
jgi:hypothetical protein